MKVFLSWSGPRSRSAASALRDWLRIVLQGVQPWMSEHDIEPGTWWQSGLASSLSEARIGIICVTSENMTSPWLMFEAGALSRVITQAQVRVIPLLLDHADPAQITGPLGQFQLVLADQAGIAKLVRSVNQARDEASRMDAQALDTLFELTWPRLSEILEGIRRTPGAPAREPEVAESLRELVQLVRSLSRRFDEPREVESLRAEQAAQRQAISRVEDRVNTVAQLDQAASEATRGSLEAQLQMAKDLLELRERLDSQTASFASRRNAG